MTVLTGQEIEEKVMFALHNLSFGKIPVQYIKYQMGKTPKPFLINS